MFGNPKLIALPVIASFDTNGNINPLYFRYNGKRMKLSVISRRECLPTIEFLCSYDDDGIFRSDRIVILGTTAYLDIFSRIIFFSISPGTSANYDHFASAITESAPCTVIQPFL